MDIKTRVAALYVSNMASPVNVFEEKSFVVCLWLSSSSWWLFDF